MTTGEPKSVLMSAEMRDAAIAELLGDVHEVHKSVRDLVLITRDTDERISARLVELRAISKELDAQKEAAFAAISIRARDQSQQAFRSEMADMIRKLDSGLEANARGQAETTRRRIVDLFTVAISTGVFLSATSLFAAWLIFH